MVEFLGYFQELFDGIKSDGAGVGGFLVKVEIQGLVQVLNQLWLILRFEKKRVFKKRTLQIGVFFQKAVALIFIKGFDGRRLIVFL